MIYIRCLFLLLLGNIVFIHYGVAASNKVPVLYVNTNDLSAFEIGLQLGREAKAQFSDIEYRYDKHLATVFKQTAFNDVVRKSLPRLFSTLDNAYQQELKGVAKAWNLSKENKLSDGFLSLDEYYLLNLLPDINLSADGVGFGVMGKASAGEGPIVARNLDWTSSPALRELQAITVYLYADRSIVNIGFLGIISLLTGFNDRGLFLTHLNAAPYSSYRNIYRVPQNVGTSVFDLRKALEVSTSVRQASFYLSGKNYGHSHNILMADRKTVQVLEYLEGEKAKVRTWRSATRPDKPWDHKRQIAVVNCHILEKMPNNCLDVRDSVQWTRLSQLAKFNSSQPADVEDISKILFDTTQDRYEIFNSKTLQSIIYLPKSGALYLYVKPVSAASLPIATHKAYLHLLSSTFSVQEKKMSFTIIWFISIVLAVMIVMLVWVMRGIGKQRL